MNESLQKIFNTIVEGQIPPAKGLVQDAVDEGIAAEDILHQALIPAMAAVGQRYEEGACFVPEMLASAHAMKSGLEVLRPLLASSGVQATGTVVIGTVKGDLHDIGKNLVGMMLEGAGFEVHDLGTDVAPDRFVSAVRDHQAQLVAMSALLTTTMRQMETTINGLREAGLGDVVKVMVGGAPLTAAYAERIGAHGYARDANQAVKLAKSLST